MPRNCSVTTLPYSPPQPMSKGPRVAGNVTAAPPHKSAVKPLPTHTSRGERRPLQHESLRFQTTTLKTSVTALSVIESHGSVVSACVWQKLFKSSSMQLDAT